MHPTRKAAIIALLLLILIALILAIKASLSSPMPGTPPTPSPLANKPAATTSAPARLHVGLYLSKTTGDQWGYSCQIVFELSRGGFDLVPILEAGTENEQAIAKLLSQWFPGKKPVDAADAEALKKLDVIVAPRIWQIPDDARAAIDAAVSNGTGLLARDGIGCFQPGSGPDISRLSGFEESSFGYNPQPMDCEIIAPHPLLGMLAGKVGRTIKITPNGTWGVPAQQTIPLIRVKDMDAFRDSEPRGGRDWTFYPLYVAQLGKGRIVGCQFPAWSPMPKDLMTATDNEFNIRAVRWLAHQLDESASASTHPVTANASQPITQPAR